MIETIASYAAANVASDQIGQKIEPDHMREQTESLAYIHNLLCEIRNMLDVITSTGYEADFIERVNLTGDNEYQINNHGLRHMLFFAAATGTINAAIAGVGNVAFGLQLGWNKLDLPDTTTVTTAPGTAINLLFKATNFD